jgi:hypothetical protein
VAKNCSVCGVQLGWVMGPDRCGNCSPKYEVSRAPMTNVFTIGCPTAEEEAILRYGKDWRMDLVKKKWNENSDAYNQWHELGADEKCAFVMQCCLQPNIPVERP